MSKRKKVVAHRYTNLYFGLNLMTFQKLFVIPKKFYLQKTS